MIRKSLNKLKWLTNKSIYFKSDVVYHFDKSFCKLGLRFRQFTKFDVKNYSQNILKEYRSLSQIGINHLFYDLQNSDHLTEFLSQKRDTELQDCIADETFSGIFLNLPLNESKEKYFTNKSFQAFMQCASQLNNLISKNKDSSKPQEGPKFKIYVGLENNLPIDYDLISDIYSNFESTRSIIRNSFDFELIFISREQNNMGNLWMRDKFLKIFENDRIGFDLNLIKTIDPKIVKEEMTKQFMQFLYQFSEKSAAYIFKDYKIQQDQENKFQRCSLGQGDISFSHIMDIFKLSEFKGYVIFDEDESYHITEDIQYFNQLMHDSGFTKRELIDLAESQKFNISDISHIL